MGGKRHSTKTGKRDDRYEEQRMKSSIAEQGEVIKLVLDVLDGNLSDVSDMLVVARGVLEIVASRFGQEDYERQLTAQLMRKSSTAPGSEEPQ